jgi:2-dehydropantoate 2-reductase
VEITIVGGGVMGRLWAAWLSSPEQHVTIIDASSDVVRELDERGIVVEGRDGSTRHAQVRARKDVGGLAPQDVVFFFVKTAHTPGAAEDVAALVGPDTAVATLQNGFGNAEVLASRYGPERVVHGPTGQGGGLTPDGHVFHAHEGETAVGPYVAGSDLRLAERVAGVMLAGGIPVRVEADVTVPLWRKRIFGASVFPIAALTGLRAGDLVHPDVFPAVAAVAAEAVAEARAAGAVLELASELDRIRATLIAGAPARASMLQDLEAHRRTEVDAISGAIADLAAAREVDAPVIRAITALVHGREHAWEEADERRA